MQATKTPTFDEAWHYLLRQVMDYGERRPDRTGVGTWSLFGQSLTVDLAQGFPACTTKKLFTKAMWGELACFLRGEHDLATFHARGCRIWDSDGEGQRWLVNPNRLGPGDLGRIYGVQWREWQSVTRAGDTKITDQLRILVENLRGDPFSRRHLVTAYNPGELDSMCLPPCHVMFQVYCTGGGYLDLAVTMRSVDLFLGLPFDVASYATLQHLLAREVGRWPRRLTFFFGDSHVYLNHKEAVKELLSRSAFEPPELVLTSKSLFDFEPCHAELLEYRCHPPIVATLNTDYAENQP